MGLSMVPEGREVFGSLTIEENLLVGTGMHAATRNWRSRAATELEAVYATFPILKDRRHSQAGLLSGGQQQMLVIGRALMTNPRLIAIDEPSLGLAPNITDQVYERLDRIAGASRADPADRRAILDPRATGGRPDDPDARR